MVQTLSKPKYFTNETKEVYARYPNGTTQAGGVAIESWTTPVVNTDFTADTTISGTS